MTIPAAALAANGAMAQVSHGSAGVPCCPLSARARLGLILSASLALEALLPAQAPWWAHLAVAAAIYVVTGGHHTLYLVWHTLPRDMR